MVNNKSTYANFNDSLDITMDFLGPNGTRVVLQLKIICHNHNISIKMHLLDEITTEINNQQDLRFSNAYPIELLFVQVLEENIKKDNALASKIQQWTSHGNEGKGSLGLKSVTAREFIELMFSDAVHMGIYSVNLKIQPLLHMLGLSAK